MGAGLVRRRTGLSREARILAVARGHEAGLRLPGPVSAGIRWRRRIDVVLLVGELRVAGGGGLWRYPVPDMVLATTDPEVPGALRVDFLEGDPVVLPVRGGADLLVALQRQIVRYGTVTPDDRLPAVWLMDDGTEGVRPGAAAHALTPAIGLLHARRARPLEAVPSGEWATGRREAAHRSRVELLRAARRDHLTLGRVSV